MIEDVKRYPACKDAYLESLVEVPRHWEVRRIKSICHFAYGDALAAASRSGGTVSVLGSNGPVGFHNSANTQGPCIVVGRKGSFGKVNYSVEPVFAIDTTFFIDTRQSPAHLRWLYYLLGWLQLDRVTKDSAIPGLDRQDVYEMRAVVPPLPEQRAIARFLDLADRRIQRYIRAKERLIELLEEQKQAIIHQAVTGQIDVRTGQPYPAYKDSGVEWLGEVPEHWEVRRLKHLTHGITVGIVVTPSKYYVDEGVPCLRSLNVSGGVVDMDNLVFISEGANELHGKSKIFRGDVVVVRTGQAGTAAVVPEELDGANCIDLLIVRRSEDLLPRFVYYYLNSRTAMTQATTQSVGAIQAHYNTSTLAQLVCPKAPREEQARIVSFLDKAIRRNDHLVALTKRTIDRFEEYRTRLIADVVTGKLDVRDGAASRPEVDAHDASRKSRESDPDASVGPTATVRTLSTPHP